MRAADPQLLSFRIGEEKYVVACRQVEHVLPRPSLDLARVGGGAILGSFSFRGAMTPVVDLCQLVVGTPCPNRISSRALMVRNGAGFVALVVERATSTYTQTGQPRAPSPHARPFVTGVVELDGEFHELIDVETLLCDPRLVHDASGTPSEAA